MNFSYKVEAHWRQKKTHKTSTTVNPLWPIPNTFETLDHTIEHDQTHHHTHEPITPTQNANAVPTHKFDHHKVQTHIITNKTHLPYQNPTTINLISPHQIRPTNPISPLNHNLQTTKHKQRHRREQREKREVREEREGRRVYVYYYVLCVCDLVLMFKFEFLFFVFGSGFMLYVFMLMFKSVIVFLCVFVQNELDLNWCILLFLILFFLF